MAEQNGTPKNNVSRKLFQVNEEADIVVGAYNLGNFDNGNLEEAKEKWNFDFKRGVPLDGDWVWEKVEEESGGAVEGSKENRNPNV